MQCEKTGLCGSLTFVASVLVVVVFVINAGLIMSNRSIQDNLVAQQNEVATKGNKIQQNSTFANINQSLIQALTTAVIARKDEQIKALLIQNDVNLSGKPENKEPAK